MLAKTLETWRQRFRHWLDVRDAVAPERYRSLRRLMTLLMVVVSITPLLVLTALNHMQYQSTIQRELVNPLRSMVGKTRASLELFLGERASTVSLITQAYSFADLADERTLTRIFRALRSEFQGFVDIGLVDEHGVQVGYVGPYNLKGVNYADQPWLHQAQVRGKYVSDVFLGLRSTPHMVLAISRMEDDGRVWVLRATIDTGQLDRLVAAMGLDADTDAFLVNRAGVLQTASRLYGPVLQKLPLALPPVSFDTSVTTLRDAQGRELLTAYAYFPENDLALLAVKPRSDVLRPWTTLQSDILVLLVLSTALIIIVSRRLMTALVNRLQASDERRVAAFAQMEHSQKLSSIGRLAAGVAHEVNNPLAVINEKAGLAQDLLEMTEDFPQRQRFLGLMQSIVGSVERARGITHRLLGFSRRMEPHRQELRLQDVVTETLGFLEREAANRGIGVRTEFAEDVPNIISDRGQLQQIVLNIAGNALAAVDHGGEVTVRVAAELAAEGGPNDSPEGGPASHDAAVRITVEDNGKGMNAATLRHIFEPFYTTKKDKGTGLGMFITYGMVRKLGGRIEVVSEEGKGTVVTVLLPLVPPSSPADSVTEI